ncbi:hypothetical protein J6590_020493 [Homalodisca vitripennis]|nr:hypothetical protein J6590_020493 [Homalodisca vitripennis]
MSVKKGSAVVIKPYYDGLLLSGMQDVAGDGLSVLSIKEKHNNCRFTEDPESKCPVISCARGLKARNSFWNLLKPDLRKVRGLECSTTESVAHMFHKHNLKNAAKPSYKRRVLR